MASEEIDDSVSTQPTIDGRDRAAIRADAAARAPFYTGDDWKPEGDGPGTALLDLFADLASDVVDRLDMVPEKHRAAFVDALGFDRLPPQAATLPLTVQLSDGAGGTIHLPSGTRGLAPATETRPELTFELTEGFEATPVAFDRLVSVDPRIDHVATHEAAIGGGSTMTLFGGTNAQQHELNIGHPEILTLSENSTVQVSVVSTADAATLASLDWEYYGENPPTPDADEGWKPLDPHIQPLPPEPELNVSDVAAILDDHGFELTTDDKTVIERWLVSTLLARERDTPIPPYVEPAREPDVAGLYEELDQFVQSHYGEYPPDTSGSFSVVTLLFKIPDPFVATELEGIESNWIRASVPSDAGPKRAKQFEAILFRALVLGAGRVPWTNSDTSLETRKMAARRKSAGRELAEDFSTESSRPENKCESFYPDDLLSNDVPLKVPVSTNDVARPFGTFPRVQDTFYVGSTEALTKIDGIVHLSYEQDKTIEFPDISEFTLDPGPQVSWEYWNGSAWEYLDVSVREDESDADRFILDSGTISFNVPDDLEPTSVAGHENHWIRARLVGGSYGPIKDEVEEVDGETAVWRRLDYVRPPELTNVSLYYYVPAPDAGSGESDGGYGGKGSGGANDGSPGSNGAEIIGDPFDEMLLGLISDYPSQCFATNNLAVTVVDPSGQFQPFEPLEETEQTLYLGFDGPLEDGSLQVFADFADFEYPKTFHPRTRWEVYTDAGWVHLSLRDDTEGLTERGVVRFTPPSATAPLDTFGERRHWLRARVTDDQFVESPYRRQLDSEKGTGNGNRCGDTLATTPPGSAAAMVLPTTDLVAHNTGMAANVRSIDDEILGSSDGTPDQEFTVTSPPLQNAAVWVDELTTLSVSERTRLVENPDVAVEVVGDEADLTAIWVRWTEVENFLAADPTDRKYTLDAVAGTITFGDGVQGAIPPRGRDNLRITYETGGGAAGNVPAGAVDELDGSLAFVDSVTNLLMSDGAADAETSASVMGRVPKRLRDRNRAVAPVDFERIANASARKLARARCFPGLDPRGQYRPGWVTVLIVPRSEARKPVPSASLREQVVAGVAEHAPASLLGDLGEERLVVRGPTYVEVTVEATMVAGVTESNATLEMAVTDALSAFLHPLAGGESGDGWPFGELPCVSDCYGILEDIEDVDHVEAIALHFESEDASRTIRPGQDGPDVNPDVLVYSGIHNLDVVGGI